MKGEDHGQATPYRHGRCEIEVSTRVKNPSGTIYVVTGYCGKPGRWMQYGLIRCGEHKVAP